MCPCFWGYFLLLCLGSTFRECQGFSALPPLPTGHLPHVEEYEVVQPLQLPLSGALNELSSSPTLYPETIRYLLGLRGNNFTLHLRRNRHLVSSDYTETYTLANGTEVTEKPQVGQHCFYQGHVEGYQNSVASVSTCLGIRGFFKTGSTIHLIEPLGLQRHASHQKRHGSTKGRHGVTKGRHGVTQERHGVTQERHGVTQERHGVTQERHGVTQERHGVTQERQGVTQERQGVTQERQSITQARHDSPYERQGSTNKRYDSTHKECDSNQEKNGGTHKRPGITQGRHSGMHERSGITRSRHGSTHEKQDSDQKPDDGIQEGHGTTQSIHIRQQKRYGPTKKRHRSNQGKHAIYKQDLKKKHRTCGVSKVSLKGELETMMAAVSMPKNWRLGSVPTDTHYVELFVVVDHREYEKYKSLKKLRHRVKEIVNHVDRLYQEINFRVVLIGLEIWDKENKAAVDSNIESTLSSFLKWRDSDLIRKKQHDNAQLITGQSFEGTAVGLARLASMCTEGSGGVSHDYSRNPFGVATTLAHELGHNLGMNHDENVRDCWCDNKKQARCIMTSRLGSGLPKKFSSCSKYNLQKFLRGNIFSSSCLNNFPALENLEKRPVCGNNFLERGEECDCGLPGECLNQCCNPKSCRLAPGAECTEGACCQACQVMPAGELCREAQNTCDLAEYCDGKQAECPENVYKENGTPCWEGYCYNGTCPTYKEQCQALWGMEADVSTDKCFLLKLPKGCKEAFYPSRKGLDKCRFLSCSRPSTKQITRHLCSFHLEDESCDLAFTKKESSSPFHMVAPGTKCGEKKVCYHRSCQDLSVYGARNCSNKCHNRGICNHKKECHCDPGWAPPNCRRKLSQLREGMMSEETISLEHGPGHTNIKARSLLVGVLVALTLMAVLSILICVAYKWKMLKKDNSGSSYL